MTIHAENLEKKFHSETIFKDLSFTAESGKITVITGSSGCGKSTLLSLLGLLQKPDQGQIFLDQKNITALSDRDASALRCNCFGFTFQNAQLIGSLTVYDNLCIPYMLAGKKPDQKAIADGLQEYGLAHRIYHYPNQLSTGQKRRISMLRALLLSPDILFADEPTNDLDEQNVHFITQQLLAYRKKQKTVILVTHAPELIQIADENYTMR
ncbi:MAG: ABC transporter ATP-binding protein [Ruminococcus sp.]